MNILFKKLKNQFCGCHRLLQLHARSQYNGIMLLALRSVKYININLIRAATSQSSSHKIVLTRLGGTRSRPNPHLKLWKCRKSIPNV